MTIQRFEDIVAWQKARALTKDVYVSTRTGAFAKDYGLKDQIQRASVSLTSEIPMWAATNTKDVHDHRPQTSDVRLSTLFRL